jgi:sn-glycerol 3-phosphate transport system substrate-binding protein
MKKKRFISLLLGSLMIFSLSACEFGNGDTSSVSAANSTPVALTFWHAMGGVNGQELQKLVDQFNAEEGKKANITVKTVYQGSYSDLMQKYKAVSQSKNANLLPDLVTIPSDSTGYIKDVKQTVWAKDLFARDKNLKQKDFLPNSVVQFSFKNKAIGIPFACSTLLMYYNKTAFEEVGLDSNRPPQTISELGEYAAKLYKTSGNKVERYGFELEAGWYQLTSWIGMQSSNGNDYSFMGNNKSGRTGPMTKVTFDKDGTMKKFLKAYVPAMKNSNAKYTGTTDQSDFIAGTNAIYISSSAAIKGIASGVGAKFKWGTAFLPKVNKNDKGGAAPGGSALYVMNRGNKKNIDAACKFIEYLTGPEVQFDWCRNTGYFPVNLKTYDLPEFKQYLVTNPYFSVAVDQIKSSNLYVQEAICGCSNAINTTIDNNIVNAIEGKITIDTAVKNMAADTNRALDSYNRANL